MKLEKLAEGMRRAREWELDSTDVMLLADIAAQIRAKTPVTIMALVEHCDAASPATNHARIKKLCGKRILRKMECAGSLRHKVLDKGERFDEFMNDLAGV